MGATWNRQSVADDLNEVSVLDRTSRIAFC